MVAPAPRTRAELDDELVCTIQAEAGRAFNLARRLLGDDTDAADAVQAAWLRAWRNRDAFRGEGPAAAWLRAIVVRESLRTLRWRSLRRWFPVGDRVPDVVSEHPAGDVALDATGVRRVVATLPGQQRVAFTLRFDEGWTVPEIAAALQLSPETVKTHLNRALARVRHALGVHHAL